ncbi:MAG TPA: DJ-1/PfpI family protein [Spirochaetota bacterium]|nr:DJ-1/PfpI family protein [Spirochaetota bacterium]HOL56213.1 DJ-1/PfpI family protein [Spirochaetota bacterium]HPP03830.1 DJ-1/PfpI family protein [Spirochaetota bacterium]
MKIAVLLAEGFEESEAVILIDIFRRASYEVTLFSITDKREITSSRNITIITDEILKNINIDNFDMLFLPGGMPGTKNLSESEDVIKLIKEASIKNKYIAAICAAPSVLAKAGILKGKKATAYPTWQDKLMDAIVENKRVVVDGKIITGRAFGSAIDMGLKIVELISGEKEKDKLKEAIVY